MPATVIDALRKKLDIPETIDLEQYSNLLEFYGANIKAYADQPAFTSLGRTISYQEVDDYSDRFASYVQRHTSLEKGDRIAVQLPNIIQQPVVILGALKAGLIVVNTNPLYTERELAHQFNDSGAKALVILANVADKAASIVNQTCIETVIVTELADLHSPLKSLLVNTVVKHVKKLVPDFSFDNQISFKQVMKKGQAAPPHKVDLNKDDIAVLQYTGGTTGVAKGAMLTHGNLLANALQSEIYFDTYGMPKNGAVVVQPLPLYHIFAFIVGLICFNSGAHTVLIPNPRDLPSMIKDMKRFVIDGFCGLNTLFVALCNNEAFKGLDFSRLQMTLSGGMALTTAAAKKWQAITGCEVYEGYGLTETSPVVAVNSGKGNCLGSVGVVAPNTDIDIRDEVGKSVALGERGELCVKGPQVMKGYWHREEATAESVVDGWFFTGDIAMLTEEGYLKIVDRKKDMIIVSGFNVFPNEVEDIATQHSSIVEAAAIGHDDPVTGEVVHLYVVVNDDSLTEAEIIAHCREGLAAYKVPKKVFFRKELPKSNVGKILRRLVKESAD